MAYKPTKEFKAVIKAELDKRAEKDPEFAKKYANPKKSIDECCSYIASEAYRQKINMAAPEEVYDWAVHYYDEESVEFKKAPEGRVVVPSSKEEVAKARAKQEKQIEAEQAAFSEKRKEELKKEAEERYIREQMEAMKPKAPKKKPTPAPANPQALPFTEQTLF